MLRSQTTDETSRLYLPPLERFQSISNAEEVRGHISRAKRLGQTPEMMALKAEEELSERARSCEEWSDELALVQYSAMVSRIFIFS